MSRDKQRPDGDQPPTGDPGRHVLLARNGAGEVIAYGVITGIETRDGETVLTLAAHPPQ